MYRSALCALVNRNLEYQNDRNRPTVLALVEEAKENLSAESYQQFLTEVFQLTQPAFGQGLEEAYAEFGMKLLPEAAGDADFEKLYGRWVKENLVRGDSWASAQAIKAAMFLKKAGASSEALIVLRQALKKQPPAKRQVGINFGVGYKQMLGIDRWGQPRYLFGGRGAPSSPTTIYAPLFPKKESADQSEWSRLVAGKLADWISDPKLDPGKVLSLSELVLKNSGKSAGQVKASVFKAVTNYLKSSAHISAVQANRWISLANQSGQPIDLEICQNLAKDNLLRSEQLESVLKRTAAKQGPAAVLEIGGVTSKYCQSEQCLSQMVAAAKAAGGGELLAKYQGMLSESMKAKDLLRPKKPKMKKGGPRKSAPVKSS